MANARLLSRTETGRSPHWVSATYAGLTAALVFVVLEMIMVPLFAGDSPWAPIRMIGAIILGRDVLPPPATFNLGVTLAALVVHFVLGVILAWILALLIFRLNIWPAIIVGAAFGLVVYWINFYGFTAAFPWFEAARNWITITPILFSVLWRPGPTRGMPGGGSIPNARRPERKELETRRVTVWSPSGTAYAPLISLAATTAAVITQACETFAPALRARPCAECKWFG